MSLPRTLWMVTISLWGVADLAQGAVPVGYVEQNPVKRELREPAAVELLPGGDLLVADIATDEVYRFDGGGLVVWRSTAELQHPTGLGLDPDGVWVADSGHHRLVLLDLRDGDELRSIELGADVVPVDVCRASDGQLWVTDSPHDQILVLEPSGTVTAVYGSVDGSPLRAPRGLAADSSGGVYVAESLGGRVLHLSSSGDLQLELGSWGMGEGQFLKPKDVVLLSDGALVVVDSHKSVVQLLEPDGSFRQLMSSSEGPHLLGFPIGLSQRGGILYVADAGAGSIRSFSPSGAAWKDGAYPTGEAMLETASIRDENASRACRQCHDGARMLSVGNWDPMCSNHPLELEEDSEVPDRFRLSDDGALLCTSCHGVHQPQPGERLSGAGSQVVDFGMRPGLAALMGTTGNDLCMECHPELLDTEESHRRRGHPVAVELPEGTRRAELLERGARFDDDRMGCMSCHPPHGAYAEPLLIIAASDGELCTHCHGDHADSQSQHPIDVDVDYITRRRILDMGGAFALDGNLTCLSCHDPHESTAGSLLRTEGARGDACRSCHEDQARFIRSGGHSEPGCEDCHGMHRAPMGFGDGLRVANVGPQACLDCHADGGDDPQVDPRRSHPQGDELEPDSYGGLPPYDDRLGCSTCHDTHGADDRLLRLGGEVGALCVECHEDQGAVLGTDHDASVVPAGEVEEPCLSCHGAHGAAEPYLFEEVAQGVNPANGRCLVCHDGSTDATEVVHYTHPEGLMLTTGGLPFRYSGPLPYYGPDGERTDDRRVGEITCTTCHDPHRWRHDEEQRPGEVDGTEQNSFLRDPDELVYFCEVCHGLEGRPQLRFFHDDDHRELEDSGVERP